MEALFYSYAELARELIFRFGLSLPVHELLRLVQRKAIDWLEIEGHREHVDMVRDILEFDEVELGLDPEDYFGAMEL